MILFEYFTTNTETRILEMFAALMTTVTLSQQPWQVLEVYSMDILT